MKRLGCDEEIARIEDEPVASRRGVVAGLREDTPAFELVMACILILSVAWTTIKDRSC